MDYDEKIEEKIDEIRLLRSELHAEREMSDKLARALLDFAEYENWMIPSGSGLIEEYEARRSR